MKPAANEVQEFDFSNLPAQSHELYQEGSYIRCRCHGSAVRIPVGKMLTKDESGYRIVDLSTISVID